MIRRPDRTPPGRAVSNAVRPLVILLLVMTVASCHVLFEGEPFSDDAAYGYDPDLAFIDAIAYGDERSIEAGLHPDSPRRGTSLEVLRAEFPVDLEYQNGETDDTVEAYREIENPELFTNPRVLERIYIFDIRAVTYGNRRRFEVLRVYDWTTN